MKKIIMTTALAATLFLGSISANAACPLQKKGDFPPPPHQQMHKQFTPEQKAEMEKRKAEMDKRLGITEEQKAQLKKIHEKSKAQIAPKVKALSEAEYELGIIKRKEINKKVYGINTFENAKLSGKSTAQLEKEIKTLHGEIAQIKRANFEESQKVFTDEQKQELKKMREEKIKKMRNHKGHRKGFGKRPPMPPMY